MRGAWTFVMCLAACRPAGGTTAGTAAREAEDAARPREDATLEKSETTSAPDARADVAPRPHVTTDWCTEGLEALDEDACFVLPPLANDEPRRLLVYLHGIVPPLPTSTQKHTVHTVVRQASTRAKAAAIVPRGRRGIGPTTAKDWYAWPTSPSTHAQHASSIIARWVELKKKLEAIAGAPFARTYLAGSSSGAYFIAALSLRGDLEAAGFPVDGFGAMSGGAAAGKGADALAGRTPRPYYVGFGTYDDDTKTNASSLVTVLKSARWPIKVAEHPFGHGAKEVYLEEAFAFWEETEATNVTVDGGT